MTSSDSQSQDQAMPNRIRAYFSLWGKECNPDSVSARTELKPTKTWRIGDVRQEATVRLHEDSGWRFEVACESTDAIEPHVVALLSELERAVVDWDELCLDGSRQVSIIVYANEYVPALYLSAEVLRRIAKVGAAVDIDLYDLRLHQ